MKTIQLQQLTLTNFKGERQRTTVFRPDITTICGGNGLGKSRHFDAFLWLLFGKDAQDRKDYEVKTRINGKELHQAECSVEGILLINGGQLRIKRVLAEDWVKPRGQAELVYKGNHTDCFWNDAPVKVGEYDKRIREIIDPCVFKMITNPLFFATMDWKLQREQLFRLAGTVSDEELATRKPEYQALLDAISNKPMKDFKAETAATKRRLKAELEQIQPRIDQTRKMMPEAEDFTAIETRLAELDKETADIDAALSDFAVATRKANAAALERMRKIQLLRLDLRQIIYQAEKSGIDAQTNARRERDEKERQINGRRADISRYEQNITRNRADIVNLQTSIATQKKHVQDLREQWFTTNATEYDGSNVCPHCGQQLPEEMIARGREAFNEAKNQRLAKITAAGKEANAELETLRTSIRTIEDSIADNNKDIAAAKADIMQIEAERDAITIPETEKIDYDTIPEYAETKTRLAALESGTDAPISADNAELKDRRKALETEIADLRTRLQKRDYIARAEREITDLEARGRELAQQIADIEQREFVMAEFTKTKITECEQRINHLFTMVTFRLFDYTLDGNPVETCIPLIDGVPYGAANSAARLNAGVDIINALCGYYGITAPIFIDNRESVNNIIPTDSQLVCLVVTNDSELIIK
ncbi:MAG: hypothetical protein LUC22_02260 [Prevotella sp.]|nr:hypothetical protein [Prevotella sp.]